MMLIKKKAAKVITDATAQLGKLRPFLNKDCKKHIEKLERLAASLSTSIMDEQLQPAEVSAETPITKAMYKEGLAAANEANLNLTFSDLAVIYKAMAGAAPKPTKA
ncbi:arginine--tRNA ligase [Novimethylophilus kurashikiensis]|uniref:Arginine--tRNA ligase n=2 Tax=Novimethylophilus kurashikiensis TaxID=1825523 RepID=A0A2R5F8E0_9PROT|nr:arginine--tRNA ligase [Novimethylophilus kurashikiensis]